MELYSVLTRKLEINHVIESVALEIQFLQNVDGKAISDEELKKSIRTLNLFTDDEWIYILKAGRELSKNSNIFLELMNGVL